MATTKPRNALKVTINPDSETSLTVGGWPINTNPDQDPLDKEPERVNVERDGKSYSFVFTSDGVKVEIWDLEDDGELGGLRHVLDLPQ